MSETAIPAGPRTPTVYFIDDSATMREVIKIAFRKENINVVACPDAASAVTQFAATPPDAVITDVIMPDKDGYEVCQFVKEHPQYGATPVILMSGVVNRTVAEKAMTVKADELIRKPFQPHELIARVKSLLNPKLAAASPERASSEGPRPASAALSNLFAANNPFAAQPPAAAPDAPRAATTVAPPATPRVTPPGVRPPGPAPANAAASAELLKLRNDVRRLELLIKKLQAELEAERQYCAALESQLQTAE
ncbi:MAG: response regulator [Candidatus Acidiferrales bacterium]